MTPLRRLLNNLRALVRGRRRDDAELSDELRAYLDAAIDAKIAAGMTRAAAERAARVEIGSAAAIRDHVRDVGWETRVDHVMHDVRRAIHGVRARGWRGVLVVLLIGIAMAANATIFSAADSFVLDRVPYPNASRLVELGSERPGTGWSPTVLPEAIPVWRSFSDLFSSFQAYQRRSGFSYVTDAEGTRLVRSAGVTPGLLAELGANPLAGRLIVSSDVRPDAAPVALIAEELAREQFGSASAAIGKSLTITGSMATIVGVLPVSFRFPSGEERIWTPLDISNVPANYAVGTLGVLAPGRSLEAVDAEVSARDAAVRGRLSPPWNRVTSKWEAHARPIGQGSVDTRVRRLIVFLCAAAGCLLLVTCANAISIELATALGRARSQAVEMALGASRGALVRTAIVEGAIGVTAAAALGTALAYAAIAWIGRQLPETVTGALVNRLDVDIRSLTFMAAIAIVVWLAVSLPVAIAATRANVLDTLKLDARVSSGSRGSRRLRHALTIAEVAVTILMLAGASLAVRSYLALLAIPTGFDTRGLVGIDIQQRQGSPETPRDLDERVLAQLRAWKDVVAASRTGASPSRTSGSSGGQLQIAGRPEPLGRVELGPYDADADFFGGTMRLPLVSGRDFRPDDPPNAVIVDERFATKFWPAGDVVGARFKTGGGWPGTGEDGFVVVGVAGHLRTSHDSTTGASDEFFPVYRQPIAPNFALSYVARMSDARHVDELRSMLRALAPTALLTVKPIEDRYAEAFANEGLAASIMMTFGAVTFVVSMAGMYGVMALLVATRTREIGVRIAIGADRVAIVRFVLGSAARLIVVGAAIGVIAAVFAARWATSLFFGVAATDPATYALVAGAIVLMGLAATWLPARRATRVDPVVALRSE
jgi:predicted permease